LRAIGFVEDQSAGAPLCRWRVADVILDVMPTDERLLGLGNRWYRPALLAARGLDLPTGEHIRVVTAPFFLATKLEAFAGRGRGDYLASPDLEDIITLIDGRPEVVEEVSRVQTELRQYLAEYFSRLLVARAFVEAIPAHLPPDAASQARLPLLLDRLRRLTQRPPSWGTPLPNVPNGE
jgi:hypothetical protein